MSYLKWILIKLVAKENREYLNFALLIILYFVGVISFIELSILISIWFLIPFSIWFIIGSLLYTFYLMYADSKK